MTIRLFPLTKNNNLVAPAIDNPVRALRHEMDSLFENFFSGFDLEPIRVFEKKFVPSINISEDEKSFELTAELPGMEPKDIDISFADGALTIKGEKKTETETKDKNFHRVERSYGSFQRSIPLPVQVEEDKIQAAFKNGVLKITLPKAAQPQPTQKKIQIASE